MYFEEVARYAEESEQSEKRLQYLELAKQAKPLQVDRRTILKQFFKEDELQLNLEKVEPVISNTPEGIIAMPLGGAWKQHKELVEKYLYSTLDAPTKMEALAAAGWNSGLFVYIPDNMEVDVPVESIVQHDGSILQYTLIVVGVNSAVNIVERTSGNPNFRSEVVEIIGLDNSRIRYANVQNISTNSVNFSSKRAKLERDASLVWFDGNVGSKLTVARTASQLVGNGSNVKSLGLMFGDESQHYDVNAIAQHIGTDTSGDMFARGVLKERAKAVFRGLIKIEKEAHRTESTQTEKMLLLSGDAEADAIPELMIDNNDVKCSHGATIGEIAESDIFYLRSRGISEEDARELIVKGFLSSITDELDIEGVEEYIQEIVVPRL